MSMTKARLYQPNLQFDELPDEHDEGPMLESPAAAKENSDRLNKDGGEAKLNS